METMVCIYIRVWWQTTPAVLSMGESLLLPTFLPPSLLGQGTFATSRTTERVLGPPPLNLRTAGGYVVVLLLPSTAPHLFRRLVRFQGTFGCASLLPADFPVTR